MATALEQLNIGAYGESPPRLRLVAEGLVLAIRSDGFEILSVEGSRLSPKNQGLVEHQTEIGTFVGRQALGVQQIEYDQSAKKIRMARERGIEIDQLDLLIAITKGMGGTSKNGWLLDQKFSFPGNGDMIAKEILFISGNIKKLPEGLIIPGDLWVAANVDSNVMSELEELKAEGKISGQILAA